jgi:hypothetical protein
MHFPIELVASFVNRSNLLKSWEKTATCAVSTSGAHGPKNPAIPRIPVPRISLTAPLSYDAAALHLDRCEKLLRYEKLATSSLSCLSL